VAKGKDKSGRLSVFKGREARLNRAIFHTLALKSPQTIYDIHKQAKAQKGLINVRYASVNKRVRFLAEKGYINSVGIKKTKAGFETTTYELTSRAYLAMLLDWIDLEDLLAKLDEGAARVILATIIKSSESSQHS